MINPVGNKRIKVFMDTNIMEDYIVISKNKYVKCDGFPESKNFYDLILFAKNNELSNFKICIPEIVIKEIQHHLFYYYPNAQRAFCDTFEKYKKVFGKYN